MRSGRKRRECARWRVVIACGLLGLGVTVGLGQSAESRSSWSCTYTFEHPQLDPMRFELHFDDTGRGTFSFWRQEAEEPIVLPLQLLASTVERVKRDLEALRFLESTEDYRAEREMPSLGTVILRVRHGDRQRSVRFTLTRHEKMRELAQRLRGIAMQEYRVFSISLARQHGPLDLDKQLRGLESELKNGWLGEPEKLLPLLRDLEQDEDLLLMVRHRAERLMRWIEREVQRSGGGGRKSGGL
ncbi:MAG: hypothetical protein N2443_04680 [Blastocatellia bacterium]|nr:hypothetical protein [Blastocatellia bacterium]